MTAVHQLVNDLWPGDAIGNECLALRDHYRAAGVESDIFARRADPALAGEYRPAAELADAPRAVLVWHFSIGTELIDRVAAWPGPKVMRYHNITPAEFFEPYNRAAAELCRQGRTQLDRAAGFIDLAVGLSDFSRRELEAAGYRQTAVCPIIRPPADPPRPDLGPRWSYLADGPLVIHVGRVAPQKRYDRLLKTAWFLERINPTARLAIIGGYIDGDPYYRTMAALAQGLGLTQTVFTDRVSQAELLGFYRSASVYLALSDHEGFCVPLIEALEHGLAVAAHPAGAVPETLGPTGVLVNGDRPALTAETVAALLTDDALRSRLTDGQSEWATRFDARSVWPVWQQVLAPVMEGASGS